MTRRAARTVRLCRVAALGRCARVLVCVDTHDARLCVYSTSRLSNIVVLMFCMCVPCGMHSLFAVAVLLLLLLLLLLCSERLFARAWRRFVSRCDVHDRRSVAALCSGMTASGTCGLSGCVVFGVIRTRCCASAIACSVLTGVHLT